MDWFDRAYYVIMIAFSVLSLFSAALFLPNFIYQTLLMITMQLAILPKLDWMWITVIFLNLAFMVYYLFPTLTSLIYFFVLRKKANNKKIRKIILITNIIWAIIMLALLSIARANYTLALFS